MTDSALQSLREAARTYAERYQAQNTGAYVRTRCASEAKELLRQADALVHNTFTFTDRWDMEPCTTPYTLPAGTWTESPNGDPEWVYMLNRHDYLPKLWQAWTLTGDRRYLDKLTGDLLNWIASNPITLEGTDATRTIDTGIRCLNWCRLLPFLLAENALTDEQVQTVAASMAEQFANLKARYITRYTQSNWGVLQTTAICAAAAWLGADCVPADLETWSWNHLFVQLQSQVLEDGVHWEQSPMYHVEVLNASVKLLVLLREARNAGRPLSAAALHAVQQPAGGTVPEAQAGPGEGLDFEKDGWLLSVIRVLSRHVLYTADPALHQMPQCDSDVTDVRDVLARAAALFADGGIYRWAAGDSLDMESAWLLGMPGIHAFEQCSPEAPHLLNWDCPRSGNLAFRSDWTEKANFTALKNSTLGSSHGHADQTHLTVYCGGKPFLVDTGRYTYREDDPLRCQLKAPAAHNLCVIDGQSGGTPDASWSYADFAEAGANYYAEKDGVHYAELPFRGTLRDGTPYYVVRRVFVLDCGVWLSVQDITCQGSHEVREYFHLHPDVQVSGQDTRFALENGGVYLDLLTDTPLRRETGVYSAKYNQLCDAPLLTRTVQMQDHWVSDTVLAARGLTVTRAQVLRGTSGEVIEPDFITAWDVCTADGACWTLLVRNHENYRGAKVFTCHDEPFYGQAVALYRNGQHCRRIRLR